MTIRLPPRKISGVPAEVLQAIRNRQPIGDPRLAALFAMTVEIVESRGRPSTETVSAFLKAGFQERDLLYIVLATAVKTLSNYANFC